MRGVLESWLPQRLSLLRGDGRIKPNPIPFLSTARPCPGYLIDHVVPLKRGGADVLACRVRSFITWHYHKIYAFPGSTPGDPGALLFWAGVGMARGRKECPLRGPSDGHCASIRPGAV